MKLIAWGSVILIILGIGAFYFYTQTSQPFPHPTDDNRDWGNLDNRSPQPIVIDEIQSIDSDLAVGSENTTKTDQAFYDFFSQDGFGTTDSDKIILFFFASWCPTCKTADEDFKTNLSKLPGNIAIFKVHYNDPETIAEDKDLAKKYGITYQHTFVQIDKNGNEITKWNGGGLDNLLSKVQ